MDTNNITPVVNETENVKSPIKIKDLSQKAILIKLSIGKFNTSKRDKTATKEVVKDNNVKDGNAAVIKRLFNTEKFAAIDSAATELRQYFNKNTLPWNRESTGIVLVRTYIDKKLKLEQLKNAYIDAVEDFIQNYDDIVKADKNNLDGLYKEEDYPTKSDFRNKFYVDISISQVENNDFRNNSLSSEEIKEINAQIENTVENAVKEAQKENINRVREGVTHLFERVSDIKNRIHTSSFTNLLDSIAKAKEMNLSEDTNLNNYLDTLQKEIEKYDPETVRDNNKERVNVAKSAAAALNDINKLMESYF